MIAPFNIYGLSKLMGEKIIQLESKQAPETRFIVGRLFNLYGTRETNPHIVPEILNQIKKQPGEITLSLGSIWPKRDMVPVQQAASSVVKSMNKLSALSPGVTTHNFATGKAISMEQMIHEIENLIQRKININLDQTKVRPVERSHLEADVSSLRDFIGTTPSADLKLGLKALLEHEGLLPSKLKDLAPGI
jgi:UDP-glucose 4-epimerase